MTQLTAHRGGSRLGPENSLAALRLSAAQEIAYSEIDVQLSSDGAVVLMHDADLLRTCGVQKRVTECALAELRELRNQKREPIPTLEEAIAVVRGRSRLIIELKDYGQSAELPAQVIAVLRERDFLGNALLCSFSPVLLEQARALEPRVKTGYIYEGRPERLPAKGEAAFVSVHHQAVDAPLVRQVHALGLELHAWTVNDRQEMVRLMALDVDNVITDDPFTGKEALAEFGRKGWLARQLLKR